MINRLQLTKEQALFAIKNGEFSDNVISSKNKVVVIMTQNWCPQWASMYSWIYSLELDIDIDIYELIYNKADYFHEFMAHKENVWQNYDVPYLRFYKNGKLYTESNYINQKNVLSILNEE